MRVHFAKTDAMRFIGNLDLHKAWERTCRRAGLPLAYSQGYDPQPKLNLASALPLGFTSQAELIDMWLEGALPIEAIESGLRAAAPPGIEIGAIEEVGLQEPTLQSQLVSARYRVTLLEPFPELEERLAELLAAPSLPRQRREKNYDLRPLLLEAHSLLANSDGYFRLELLLQMGEGTTGRPDEVLAALGYDPLAARWNAPSWCFDN